MPALKTFGLLMSRQHSAGREAAIEQAVKTFRLIGSPGYPMDEQRLREVAGASYDRGHSPAGVARQMHAITASGDRTRALRQLRLPTTVIHGNTRPPGPTRPAAEPPPGRSPAPACG